MEEWELIRRLLAGANGSGQSFMVGLIAGDYLRDLAPEDADDLKSEIFELADELAQKMEEIGLLRPAAVRRGGAAVIGAMERTELGDELYQALCGRNVVMLFESMHAQLDAGEIRRMLHQLR
ncbi:hypothetical protein [Stutzerimonas nitrititolerans]|uniref:hypothetical protein n=1 Tax=Stutzerimonas nitrititolerans TaxID=2482751 RepID=UPI0028A7C200|nr:hypothetical protein [Stutzerimonas nitrititolerans]